MSGLNARLRSLVKSNETLYRLARPLYRWSRARTTAYSDWDAMLRQEGARWQAALVAAQGGPKVLLATSLGAELVATKLESMLGVALTMRGAEVHVLLCDEALPACQLATVDWYPDPRGFVERGPRGTLCGDCFRPAERFFRRLGLRVHRYGDYLRREDHEQADGLAGRLAPAEMAAFRYEGLAVGEHALAGALRFFARASLAGEPAADAVLRRYFRAALLTAVMARRALRAVAPECTVMHHGIYVPQGLVGEAVRRAGRRAAVWNVAYRKRRFIFSHEDTYHHTLVDEPPVAWEALPWTPERDRELMDYLATRFTGAQDWISFQSAAPTVDPERIAAAIGLDRTRPAIGLLTNVMWDAQLHYPANAFPDMLAWLVETIAYFACRPDVQLVVRVHPAEVKGAIKSRQRVVDEIRRAFPEPPGNLIVIPPDSPVSTYRVMELCDAAVIYGTKTGVELCSMGVPVVVAGEAWIRGKGISRDASSRAEYFRLLDDLPCGRRLEPAAVTRARRYAYHFFFRRMIPLDLIEETGAWPPFRVRSGGLDGVLPGRSPGLDVICDGILSGSPFVYPAEHETPARAPVAAGVGGMA